MKKIIIMALAAAALSSCHTQNNVDNFTINVDAVSSATTSADIPFTVAGHYFVRNDVDKLPNGKITRQKDFDAIFGMAATMGEGGRPTAIDFDRQYVISVARPATDRLTELQPVSLKADGDGGLIFTYRVSEGAPTTYTMQPSLIIVVDKKYRGMVTMREEK